MLLFLRYLHLLVSHLILQSIPVLQVGVLIVTDEDMEAQRGHSVNNNKKGQCWISNPGLPGTKDLEQILFPLNCRLARKLLASLTWCIYSIFARFESS